MSKNPELMERYLEYKALASKAAKVFQPRTPISTTELFAGRWNELQAISDAVNQTGLHVVIYGERGVGKTSLANVLRPTIYVLDNADKEPSQASSRLIIKGIANSGDTFASIWKSLFNEITWADNRPTIGLVPGVKGGRVSLLQAFGLSESNLTVADVRRVLQQLPGSVFVIDEFDRTIKNISNQFTDLIKTLSDMGIDSTVVIVGVSETIDKLVADHASIGRAVTQIFLKRMTPAELTTIISNAEKSLSVVFDDDAKRLITHISQGLPHYTHLIGLHSVRVAALQNFSHHIDRDDVYLALEEATKQAEQTCRDRYSLATHSAHRDALYKQVLLACAIAASQSSDAFGYFNPSEVIEPLSRILGRKVEIATFTNHLGEFYQVKRGEVLERTGQQRAYRFRFHDPMLVPFVFMDAIASSLLKVELLSELLDR